MIVLLTGENSFEITREVGKMRQAASGDVTIYDASDVTPHHLPELFMGQSLFSEKRLVIIDTLSENKPTWDALEPWTTAKNDDTLVVLIEPKPDKRTRTYKQLVKEADMRTFPAWGSADKVKAAQWVLKAAEEQGCILTQAQARRVVQRAGVDQWQLFHEIEKLSVLDQITDAVIDSIVESHPEENIFALLETALRGDVETIQRMLETLRRSEDPYRMFGLLSTQVLQLAAIGYGNGTPSELAKSIGLPPFVVSKQMELAHQCSKRELKTMVESAAAIDVALKTSLAQPWVLVEQLLLKIALR